MEPWPNGHVVFPLTVLLNRLNECSSDDNEDIEVVPLAVDGYVEIRMRDNWKE